MTGRLRRPVWLFLVSAAACGGGDAIIPTSPPLPAPVTVVQPQTTWVAKGSVVSVADGSAIANATVRVDGLSTVTSDANGRIELVSRNAAIAGMTISAAGYLSREAWFELGRDRDDLRLDLIPASPPFSLAFYRELARDSMGHGGHQPGTYLEIRRWTTAPKVYIQTTWADTGVAISPTVVDWTAREIRRVMPQLSAGQFADVHIETGPTDRTRVAGWIYLHWSHSGNYGYVGANPGEVQLDTAHTCNSAAVLHEFGHAMGYWHTTERPSAMGGGYFICEEANLTAAERYHAQIVYSRAPGNLDIDREPSATLALQAGSGNRRVWCDLTRK